MPRSGLHFLDKPIVLEMLSNMDKPKRLQIKNAILFSIRKNKTNIFEREFRKKMT